MASPPPIACYALLSACTDSNCQATQELSFICHMGTGFACCVAQVSRLRI